VFSPFCLKVQRQIIALLAKRKALEEIDGAELAKTKDYKDALNAIDKKLDALEDYCPVCKIDILTGKMKDDWLANFSFGLEDDADTQDAEETSCDNVKDLFIAAKLCKETHVADNKIRAIIMDITDLVEEIELKLETKNSEQKEDKESLVQLYLDDNDDFTDAIQELIYSIHDMKKKAVTPS